ncbi:hypothetical protein AVEN_108602-1 [Araneus ventricosus]|uniref:Uncharacterized protein n=1 Tax=Araneus ventricosus TaxID=182803 RepID=A0A4Y2DH24_ARAVE|nr:hypothetical protein AVEN_108602-1 [Araneus ventricosus]
MLTWQCLRRATVQTGIEGIKQNIEFQVSRLTLAVARGVDSVFKPSTDFDGNDECKSNCVGDLVKIESVTYDDVVLAIRELKYSLKTTSKRWSVSLPCEVFISGSSTVARKGGVKADSTTHLNEKKTRK